MFASQSMLGTLVLGLWHWLSRLWLLSCIGDGATINIWIGPRFLLTSIFLVLIAQTCCDSLWWGTVLVYGIALRREPSWLRRVYFEFVIVEQMLYFGMTLGMATRTWSLAFPSFSLFVMLLLMLVNLRWSTLKLLSIWGRWRWLVGRIIRSGLLVALKRITLFSLMC